MMPVAVCNRRDACRCARTAFDGRRCPLIKQGNISWLKYYPAALEYRGVPKLAPRQTLAEPESWVRVR